MVAMPDVDTSLMLAHLTLLRKGIVALSADYPLCTLPYILLSKIPEKRGGHSCPSERVILAEGILKDPLFAKTLSCTTGCCFYLRIRAMSPLAQNVIQCVLGHTQLPHYCSATLFSLNIGVFPPRCHDAF